MAEAKKVIKISPELDAASAKKLNSDTKKAFSSNGFSNSLISGFAKAGLAFAAATGIGKLLDSANDVASEASKIATRLAAADETLTRAKYYGVSVERIGRLEDIAAATGLKDSAQLFNAIDRFGHYIRDDKENGDINADKYSDNNFDAFLQFVSAMKKASPNVRQAEMYKALGKTSGKFADFIESDWGEIESRLGARTTRSQWESMAGLNDELDLQETIYNRKARNYLADTLDYRNHAIERNLITNIQNQFDEEIRDIATTWGREIKRQVGYLKALGEAVRDVSAVFDTLGKAGPMPDRFRTRIKGMPDGWIAGMSVPTDNSTKIQSKKAVNQSKKGVNE